MVATPKLAGREERRGAAGWVKGISHWRSMVYKGMAQGSTRLVLNLQVERDARFRGQKRAARPIFE